MREKDVHKLIEQQDYDDKQRVWERINAQMGGVLPDLPVKRRRAVPKKVWWTAFAMALVCIVTLSVVLPLTLGHNEPPIRFCDATQYTVGELGQTLREYSSQHNRGFMYVDWYGNADEVITTYGRSNEDEQDIFFFSETLINGQTGEQLVLSITDNHTRVDIFNEFYDNYEVVGILGINVQFKNYRRISQAAFEYKGYIYYLRIDVVNGQARLSEIIEGMLNNSK